MTPCQPDPLHSPTNFGAFPFSAGSRQHSDPSSLFSALPCQAWSQGGRGGVDSAYSALDPAFFPGRNSNGTSVGGVPTAPLSIPCYCGSSPLPQALRVCSYQMQITLRTLLAGVLTPQDPSRFFFSLSPARFAMLGGVRSRCRCHLPVIWDALGGGWREGIEAILT